MKFGIILLNHQFESKRLNILSINLNYLVALMFLTDSDVSERRIIAKKKKRKG